MTREVGNATAVVVVVEAIGLQGFTCGLDSATIAQKNQSQAYGSCAMKFQQTCGANVKCRRCNR